MGKTLMRRTEVYRVDNEEEVEEIILDAQNSGGELTKKIIETKQKKSKGEVIAEHIKVTVQVDFAGEWDDLEDNNANN